MLFTMHATVMIFFVIIPILAGAFGNFLIPLMIGADDMAFPDAEHAQLLVHVAGVHLLIGCSFFVAGDGAGGRLDRLSAAVRRAEALAGQRTGQTLWLLGLTCVGVSSMMGSVNYMTTIIQMRAPGMTMFRLPMTIWAMFITAILQAFALPVLTAAGFMQLIDRMLGTGFFIPEGWTANNARAWQPAAGSRCCGSTCSGSIRHPAVYIMILPAMGMVSDIIACFARKPLFGYKPMVYSIAGIAGLGFIVWGHHMFVSGMNPVLGMTFMVATMMIALPSADQGLQLAGHDLGRQDSVHHADAVRPVVRVDVHHRRPVGHFHGRHAGRHLHSRHVLHRGPLSLRAVRRHGDGRVRGDLFLVPQDVRPHDERDAGARFTSSSRSSSSTARSTRCTSWAWSAFRGGWPIRITTRRSATCCR